jgi:hypothetical protein
MSITRSITRAITRAITRPLGGITACWFDGTDDFIASTGTPLPVSADWAMSFEMWIDPTWTPGVNTYFMGQRTSSGNQMMFGLDSAGTTARFLVGASTGTIAGLSKGVPYLCTIARVGNDFTATVTGIGSTTLNVAHSLTAVAGTFKVGTAHSLTTFFKGVIRDVVVDGVLSWLGIGNTAFDWEDQIGSDDGNLNGSPVPAYSTNNGATWALTA